LGRPEGCLRRRCEGIASSTRPRPLLTDSLRRLRDRALPASPRRRRARPLLLRVLRAARGRRVDPLWPHPGQGAEAIGDFDTSEHAEEVFARITGRSYTGRCTRLEAQNMSSEQKRYFRRSVSRLCFGSVPGPGSHCAGLPDQEATRRMASTSTKMPSGPRTGDPIAKARAMTTTDTDPINVGDQVGYGATHGEILGSARGKVLVSSERGRQDSRRRRMGPAGHAETSRH